MSRLAEDAYRRKRFEHAIQLLLRHPSGRATLTDLFPGSRGTGEDDFARKGLARMRVAGIISINEAKSVGQPSTYSIIDREALKELLEDKNELTKILWPGQAIPDLPKTPEPPEPKPVPAPVPSPPPNPGTVSQPAEAKSEERSPEEAKLQETIVRLLAAALESMVYIRERVDAIERKVNKLEELWK